MEPRHPVEAPDPDAAPVYAATYDHVGIILWGLESLKRTLASELEWLERYPGFRVGWDHEAWTYDWLAEHEPAVLAGMRAGLARFAGRLGVGSSTYGQPLSAFIDGESNIRQLTMALDATEERLGYRMTVYLMSEHPFHAQLPQLLVGAGFTTAVLRTHFMMYGHNPECDEPVVRWQGADGSAITAVPTYRGQAATAPQKYRWIWGGTSTLDNRIMTDSVSERCPHTLAEMRRRFGTRIRPLVATRADDPRAHESLIQAHEDDPDCRWIVLEDLPRLLPQPRFSLAAGANDFRPRMPWGYCGNRMWQWCREAEVAVQIAERATAIARALGAPDAGDDIRRAWKDLLVAQHHDILICGLEDEARRFLDPCRERAAAVTARALAAVAPRIGSAPGDRTVFFNPLGWERTEWVADAEGPGGKVVTVPALGYAAVNTAAASGAAAGGETPFSWRADARSELLRYEQRRTTADGHESSWDYEPVGHLRTPFYDVYTSPTGGIRLLLDRASGERLLAPPKTSGTLAAIVDGRDCESVGRIVEARLDGGRAILVEEGDIGGIPWRSEWEFSALHRRIDWRSRVTFANQLVGRPRTPIAGRLEEQAEQGKHPAAVTAWNDHEHKLRIRFYPYHGAFVTGVRDLPFLVAETGTPYLEGLTWSALTDGRVGVALLNRGLMGSIRESDGALSAVLAFSLPYIWHTRMLTGEYTYELGILPFLGDWRSVDLPRRAQEYGMPLVAHRLMELRDSLGGTWSPYRERGDGQAMLSALFARGGRTCARFWEARGGKADVAFDWMGRRARLRAVDLREREQAVLGGAARLGPWQVQTVEIMK